MEPDEDTHSLSSSELLNIAQNHLRLRNYFLSSQYALQSLHSDAADPNLRHRAQQIVAVSDILSASSETLGGPFDNWYSVLGIDTFCSDINLIRSKFKSLLLLLGPVRSTFPVAEEAMSSAWKAWNVLGSPQKKSELDAQLNAALAWSSPIIAGESESFWTVCPYCYWMFEYARVFEGYCLRCQNSSCRRVFQGVSTRTTPPPPPPSVGSNQDACFSCFAYFPLGMEQGTSNGTTLASWSPFVGMFGLPEERTAAQSNNTAFVDISDDTEESEASGLRNGDVLTGSHVRYGPNENGKMLMRTGKMFQANKNENLTDAVGNGVLDVEDNCEQYEQEIGFVSEGCTRDGFESNFEADVQFVEKDGEIFLEMPSGDERY